MLTTPHWVVSIWKPYSLWNFIRSLIKERQKSCQDPLLLCSFCNIAVLLSPKVAFQSIFSKSTKDLILKGAKHPVLLLSLLCISGFK